MYRICCQINAFSMLFLNYSITKYSCYPYYFLLVEKCCFTIFIHLLRFFSINYNLEGLEIDNIIVLTSGCQQNNRNQLNRIQYFYDCVINIQQMRSNINQNILQPPTNGVSQLQGQRTNQTRFLPTNPVLNGTPIRQTTFVPHCNNQQSNKRSIIGTKQPQQKKESDYFSNKKVAKFDNKYQASSAKQIGYYPFQSQSQPQLHLPFQLNDHNPQDQQAMESESMLRSTCPNLNRKIESNTLRMTTNNTAKISSALQQARKLQQQQQQKNMKKNGVAVQTIAANRQKQLQTPFKTMTQSKKGQALTSTSTPNQSQFQPSGLGQNGQMQMQSLQSQGSVYNPIAKKPLEKPTVKSLNELLFIKASNGQKAKKNVINGFQIYKLLGKGKFGQVHLARHVETGFIVALKKIIKAKVIQYKMIQQFKRQIRLHSALDHPNIVKFYGFFQDKQNIYLILQYISGGTLFDYLTQKDMLCAKQAAGYLKDTILALSYMHERSIAHRDIKPQNIVLTGEKVAKLCDFGWSALVQTSRTTYCGTFDYAPPEILERKNYDTAVDIWCIGVLTFQLLTGRVPFQGEKRKQIMQKILSVDKKKIDYPVDIPEDAKNFIQLLVQKDPNLRPKCKDLLKHPFFENNLKDDPNYQNKRF